MTNQENGDNNVPLLENTNQRKTSNMGMEVRQESTMRPIDEYGMPVYEETKLKKHSTTALKNIKSRKQALLKSLLHVPAIAITLGVLSLTFRNVFWEQPSDRSNAILNSLQFAAQLHGSLVVVSLSAILLHFAHHEMVGKHGTPLGFISSSFQLNSLTYIFRREFTSLGWIYILTFIFAFVLAILSGPSSAITMIPRLQFWSVNRVWLNKGDMDFKVFIEANENRLYPTTLAAGDVPNQCFSANASLNPSCPSYGARMFMLEDDGLLSGGKINRTIQSDWIRYLVGNPPMAYSDVRGAYTSSTLSTFLGHALMTYENALSSFGTHAQQVLGVSRPSTLQDQDDQLLARYDLSFRSAGKTIPTRKPLVGVECVGFPANATSLTLFHDRLIWPPWSSDPIQSSEWNVPVSDFSGLSVDLNSTLVNSSWINIDQFGTIKPSLGAYFSTPETFHPSSCYACPQEIKSFNYSQYACTIDARWKPTVAFSDSSFSAGVAAIFDADPDPSSPIVSENGPKAESLPNVFIAEGWSRALDVPWIDSLVDPRPTNRTVLDVIGQACLDKHTFINATWGGRAFQDGRPHRIHTDPMKMLLCLQASLSVYLTDALARTQESIPTYFVVEGHNLQLDEGSSSAYYSKDVFLVQDFYKEISQAASKSETQFGRVSNISKADFADPNRFTEMHFSINRWGYGWGFQDSKLVFVGAVLLLVHVALCLGYMAWITIRGDYRSAGFETIGELVSMAMYSGASGEYVESVDEKRRKKEVKRWWNRRFGVREVAVDDGTALASTGASVSPKNLVLRRVDDYDEKDLDLEQRWRPSQSTVNENIDRPH